VRWRVLRVGPAARRATAAAGPRARLALEARALALLSGPFAARTGFVSA